MKAQVEAWGEKFRIAEGPLWLVRLLPTSQKENIIDESNAAFPYQRILLLSVHHSIADGHTNCLTVDLFLRILDDLMKGNPINDHQQLGDFVDGNETFAMLEAKILQLKNNEEQLKAVQAAADEVKKKEMLTQRAFNLPKMLQGTTKMVKIDFDEETTRKFFQKSKKEGVTVNSAFTAIVTNSLTEMAKDSGTEVEKYYLHVFHAINMRQFWTGDTSKALGMHIVSVWDTLPGSAWQDNFWEYARFVHRSIRSKTDEKEVLTPYALKFLHDEVQESKDYSPHTLAHDVVNTNMGNLDVLIPAKGDKVRLIHLMRSSRPMTCTFLFFFHTFRGRFMVSLCYPTDLKTEVAETLVTNVSESLKRFC